MKYTECLADFIEAFEKWENDFRVNPDNYLSSIEVEGMEVQEVSKDRGKHFLALLLDNTAK